MQALRSHALAVLLLILLPQGTLPAEPPRPGPRTDLYGDPLPPGALARIGTIRLRHGSHADGVVCFAADGKTLLSTAQGDIVHRWDVATGREIRRLATIVSGEASDFSPDGSLLVSAVSAPEVTIAVWDLKTEREQIRCRFPARDSICSVSLAPDGKMAAAGTNGQRILVWDLPSGRPRWQRKADTPVQHVICTLGGTVVTRTQTGVVSVWDAASGKELRRVPGWSHNDQGGLAVSPDGTVLAVCEESGATALYAAQSGADLRRLTGPFGAGERLQFSHDSRLLLTTGGEGVGLWEVASGRLVRTLPVPSYHVTSLDLSPDGKLVALAGPCTVRLYDLATGRQLHHKDAPDGDIPFVAFTPDGSTFAMVGGMAEGNFGAWDPTTGRRLQAWKSASDQAAFCFTPDGRAIFVPEHANVIRLQDLLTGRELRRFVLGGQGPQEHYLIVAVEPSPNGKTLTALVLGEYGDDPHRLPHFLVTWDVAAGRQLSRAPSITTESLIALAPGARLQAHVQTGAAPAILLQDAATGSVLRRLEPSVGMNRWIFFSPDGTLLVAFCAHPRPGIGDRWKRSVLVWEVATGLLLYRLEPEDAGNRVAFSADGRFLATASGPTGPIQLWDLANGAEAGRWYGHSADVSAMAFAPDNARLATGLYDCTALIWDLAPARRRLAERTSAVGPADLDRLWADLAGTDARKAQTAIWALVAAPDLALELFGRLRPATVNREPIPRLIAQLDSPRYAEREAAARRLEALGLDAVPQLRKALDGRPTLELRRRVEALLAVAHAVRPPQTAEERRRVRAVRVLERLGSPEARRLLAELAAGPGAAEETWQAQAALDRLTARPRVGPRR